MGAGATSLKVLIVRPSDQGALECVCGDIKCQDQDKHRNRGTANLPKETVYEFGARLVDHRAPARFSLNAKSKVRQDNFAFNCRDED